MREQRCFRVARVVRTELLLCVFCLGRVCGWGATHNSTDQTNFVIERSECFDASCAAGTFVDLLLAHRPFESEDALLDLAAREWIQREYSEDDRLEAFAAHPRIGHQGQSRSEAKHDSRSSAWSQGEQRGVSSAANSTLDELALLNKKYYEKFGFVYLICATGKSAEEMLEILRTRVTRTRGEELRTATEEQGKITRLRLVKLLTQLQLGNSVPEKVVSDVVQTNPRL